MHGLPITPTRQASVTSKRFRRKRPAKTWLVETQHEVKQGVHTPVRTSITVAEAGETWIAQAETGGRPRGLHSAADRQHLRYHITPFIGQTKLAELAPATVASFPNALIREGRSRAMAKKAVGSLGAMLAAAMASGKVARNVVRDQARQHGARQRRRESGTTRD